MEGFKGTQGPWRATSDFSEITASATSMLEGSKSIADVSFVGKDIEEVHANALVLGASLDLLDALLAVLPHAELIINSDHPDHKKARLAINRALGRMNNEG